MSNQLLVKFFLYGRNLCETHFCPIFRKYGGEFKHELGESVCQRFKGQELKAIQNKLRTDTAFAVRSKLLQTADQRAINSGNFTSVGKNTKVFHKIRQKVFSILRFFKSISPS